MKLCIDESGNSGADLHDLSQPIFGYAGVWISPEVEPKLEAFMSGLRQQFRLQGTGELKGKTLLNSSGGRRAVVAVLETLRGESVPLALVAVHKAFMAAGVVVEDCTDPAYNAQFTNEWTWNTKLKEPLAERIMRAVSQRVLEAAWRARQGTDKALFVRAYESLLGQAVLNSDQRLSDLGRKMRLVNFDDVWAAAQSNTDPGWGYSPNLSGFGALMFGCDLQGEALGFQGVDVLHDNQSQFEGAFTTSFNALANAAEGDFTLPNGNRTRLPLRCLKNLTFVDSTSEVGIRVGDVVASAFRLAVQEFTTRQGSRSADYIDALRKTCRTRALIGQTPFLVGPESWQASTKNMLTA
jgi:hypothetical protein